MNLKQLTLKEEMIGLHKNSIYLSSRLRKDKQLKEDDRFQFLYDKESKIIVMIKAKEGGVRLNDMGYCKTRINNLMPHGRYYLNEINGDCLTFKYKKV